MLKVVCGAINKMKAKYKKGRETSFHGLMMWSPTCNKGTRHANLKWCICTEEKMTFALKSIFEVYIHMLAVFFLHKLPVNDITGL